MTKYILIIGLMPFLFTPGPVLGQTPHGREYLSLNGVWHCIEENGTDGIAAGWVAAKPSEAQQVVVPNSPSFKPKGVVWYWREATLPAGWTKLNIRLRFQSVAGQPSVWINGKPSSVETQITASATFDITKELTANTPNRIAVRLIPRPSPNNAKSSSESGRIEDEVTLIASDEAHIESIDAEPGPVGWITLHVRMNNTSDKSGDAQLQAEVFEASEPKKRISASTINVVVSPGRNRADMSLKIKRPKEPTPAAPRLYRATVTFRQLKDILDNDTVSFSVPASTK
jgi:beta-galactosidase/beta-glucuronidase